MMKVSRQARKVWGALIMVALLPGEASAKDKKQLPAPPEVYVRLIDCRTIADSAARLACFDKQVAELQQAQERRELVVVDQGEVKEAKKGLFGFSLPQIKLFGGGSEEDVTQLETTIASARQYTYGRWRIVLADGAVWEQIDDQALVISPKAGDAIVIKRAAFGSFKAQIGRQPSIRVRRVS